MAVVDVATGQRLATYRAHTGSVMDLTLAAGGDVLWSAGRDGVGAAWDLTGRDGVISSRRVEQGLPTGDASVATGVGLAVRWDDLEDPGWGTPHVVDVRRGEVAADGLRAPATAARFVWTTAVSGDGSTGAAVWGTGEDPTTRPPSSLSTTCRLGDCEGSWNCRVRRSAWR